MAQESTHVYGPVAYKLGWFRLEAWLDVRSEFGLTLLTPLFSRFKLCLLLVLCFLLCSDLQLVAQGFVTES